MYLSASEEPYDQQLQQAANEYQQKTGKRLAVLLITNPDNPTGTVYSKDRLLQMLTWCVTNKVHLIRYGPSARCSVSRVPSQHAHMLRAAGTICRCVIYHIITGQPLCLTLLAYLYRSYCGLCYLCRECACVFHPCDAMATTKAIQPSLRSCSVALAAILGRASELHQAAAQVSCAQHRLTVQ